MRTKPLPNTKNLFLILLISMLSNIAIAAQNNLINDYCRKENKLNGVGLVNTITEFRSPDSWLSSACTGSLVNYKGAEFVLTAAHCVVDLETHKIHPIKDMTFHTHHGCGTKYFEANVEKLYLSPGVKEYFLEHAIDIKANHDWAILKLKKKSPPYIKKYQLEVTKKSYLNAMNFGFGALRQPNGFPQNADGDTLLGYSQRVKRLFYEPIMLLSSYMIVGMSGGPVLDLNTFNVIGINSHAIQKVLPSGGWVYQKNSQGSYPDLNQLDNILKKF